MIGKLIRHIIPLFLFVAIPSVVNSQDYIKPANENQHLFSFDVTGGVSRIMFSDISLSYIGAPVIKNTFNFSGGANINYLFKSTSRLSFGGAIGLSRLGARELWHTDSTRILDSDYFADVITARLSISYFLKDWRFSLKPGLAFFTKSKRIDYQKGVTYYNIPHWTFYANYYKFGPNVLLETSKKIYEGVGVCKELSVLLRTEYHFATLFFNTSLGVHFKLN